jgi:glyoxylase-like metal-dependent hydrolase (beta-lactamase superfamily II)
MKKQNILKILTFLFLFLSTFSPYLISQEPESLSIEKVSGDVYCLYGQGGNIGILKGKESLLVVDSQYAKTADEVLKAIEELSSQKIQYLINTHYHGDHTGGNSILGRGARIISHENCKSSLMAGLKPEESPESIGAPQETYEDDMSLEVDGETVRLLYFGPAHTSGDTVVVFESAKVIHAGDLFFHGLPPYIDVKDGADTKNWIATIGKLAEMYPDFRLIPGHGKVTEMDEFLKFADYLKYLRKEVAAAIQAGKTREQAQETIDLSKFSHIRDQGEFLTKKANIGWIYDELTRNK